MVLFVDNCTVHPTINYLNLIGIIFIPTNNTSKLQKNGKESYTPAENLLQVLEHTKTKKYKMLFQYQKMLF